MYPSLKTTGKLDKIYKTLFKQWTIGNTEDKRIRKGLWSLGFLSGGTLWLQSRDRDPKQSMAILLSRGDRNQNREAWGFWKMWSKVLEWRELSRTKLTNLYGNGMKSLLNIKAFVHRMKFYKAGQKMTRVLWDEWFPELTQSWESFKFPPAKGESS